MSEDNAGEKKMVSVTWASLFREGFDTIDEAIAWVKSIEDGTTTEFVPVHGRIAGYHVIQGERAVPIQAFDPPIKEGSAVIIVDVNSVHYYAGNGVSIATNDDGKKLFYPHVNVDIEYEPAEVS